MSSPFVGWFRRVGLNWAGVWIIALLAGCAGNKSPEVGASGGAPSRPAYVDVLRKGDVVKIVFSGNPTPPEEQEERIKEDGTINLPLVGAVQAEGKSSGQLQKEIQDLYVPKYYLRLNVTVRTENREFFVNGEVRRPDRFVYTGEITVLKAVSAAGGFTDFAARRRIQLVRSNGDKFRVDGEKAKDDPRLDLPVLPGDMIVVPRRNPFGR